jgi:hypothetical protein
MNGRHIRHAETFRFKHLCCVLRPRRIELQTKRGSAGATAKPQATTPAKDA